MDSDSLHLAAAHGFIEDCIKLEKNPTLKKIRLEGCVNIFSASLAVISLERILWIIANTTSENLDCPRKVFHCTEMLWLHCKTYCWFVVSIRLQIESSSATKHLLKKLLEGTASEPLEKRRVPELETNLQSTIRCFPIMKQSVCTLHQCNWGLLHFYWKKWTQWRSSHRISFWKFNFNVFKHSQWQLKIPNLKCFWETHLHGLIHLFIFLAGQKFAKNLALFTAKREHKILPPT